MTWLNVQDYLTHFQVYFLFLYLIFSTVLSTVQFLQHADPNVVDNLYVRLAVSVAQI